MKKRLLALVLALAMALTLVACGSSSSTSDATTDDTTDSSAATEETTEGTTTNSGETITIICGYGAGGTADAIARKFAAVAGNHSDYNWIVSNVTGGDGFQAAAEYVEEPTTTHDLLVYGFGLAYRHDLGNEYGTEEVYFDRHEIYPIASIDSRTWIVYTTPDQSLESILEKAKTEGIKMSGGNPLSDPHLAFGSVIAQEGGTLTVVSGYDGGAEQKKGLTDGEVDVFVGSTQAAMEEVEAGTLIPILAISEDTFEGFTTPDGAISVPSVAGDGKAAELSADIDFSSSVLPAGGYLATRTGADQAWIDEVEQIAKDVWADEEFSGWIEEQLLNNFQIYDEEADAYMEEACVKALDAYAKLSGN